MNELSFLDKLEKEVKGAVEEGVKTSLIKNGVMLAVIIGGLLLINDK